MHALLFFLAFVHAASPPDSLRFTVHAPDTVQRGAAVPITLRLTNVSDHPVDAHFLGRTIAFDIVVTDKDGVVWRRLQEAVPSILQIRTLAAGETLEWKDVWRPAKAGRYQVQGLLPSDAPEPLRTAQVSVVVR